MSMRKHIPYLSPTLFLDWFCMVSTERRAGARADMLRTVPALYNSASTAAAWPLAFTLP